MCPIFQIYAKRKFCFSLSVLVGFRGLQYVEDIFQFLKPVMMMLHSVKSDRKITAKKSAAVILGSFPEQNGTK